MKVFQVLSLLGLTLWLAASSAAQSVGGGLQGVNLAWNRSADASVTGYAIYYGKPLVFTNKLNVGNVSRATIPNLEVGTAYIFYVKSYNAAGRESDPSNLIIHTPLPPTPPAAPSHLSATVVGGFIVRLQWRNNASAVEGFYVDRSVDGINYERIGTWGPMATNAFISGNLPAGTYPYWFRVSAFRGSLVSTSSQVLTAGTNRADLVLTGLSYAPVAPVVGTPVSFQATVKNQGAAYTPQGLNVMVTFSINGLPAVTWCRLTNSLAPGASVTVTAQEGIAGLASWAALAGLQTVIATVDAAGAIAEADEDNNTFQTTIPVALPTAPMVNILVNRTTLQEGDPAGVVVTLQRSGLTLLPLTVAVQAAGRVGFLGLPTLVVIPAGQSATSFTVTPVHNPLLTGRRTAELRVVPNINYQLGTLSKTLTVEDRDIDTDRDGMSDASEQLAGTQANNAASNLKITRIVPGPNNQVTLHWSSVPGVTYRVLSRALHETDWTQVSPVITANSAGSSWTLTATNPAAIYGLGL